MSTKLDYVRAIITRLLPTLTDYLFTYPEFAFISDDIYYHKEIYYEGLSWKRISSSQAITDEVLIQPHEEVLDRVRVIVENIGYQLTENMQEQFHADGGGAWDGTTIAIDDGKRYSLYRGQPRKLFPSLCAKVIPSFSPKEPYYSAFCDLWDDRPQYALFPQSLFDRLWVSAPHGGRVLGYPFPTVQVRETTCAPSIVDDILVWEKGAVKLLVNGGELFKLSTLSQHPSQSALRITISCNANLSFDPSKCTRIRDTLSIIAKL